MSVRSTAPRLFVFALWITVAAPAAADPPRWTFLDLKATFNVVEAIPSYGVNDQGRVAGWGVQGFFGGSPQGPFLTQPNSPVNWASRAADPPINPTLFVDQLYNGTYNNAPWNPNVGLTLRPMPNSVNNLGVATGGGYSYPHAMTYLATTSGTTAIGPTGVVCIGHNINDANVVAGIVTDPGHAIRIAGGVTTDLGTFRTLPPNAYNDASIAYGINQAGTIVGWANSDTFVGGVGSNERRAFRWSPGGGGLQDLGGLGGPFTIAYDISNDGKVTGSAMDLDYSQFAVVWSPANVLTKIPTFGPGYTNIAGRFINDAGWVVGPAYGGRNFFYDGTQTYDLATLLDDDGTNWSSLVITDMNASGQMVGYGMNDVSGTGARRAFLLTPYGGPTPAVLALEDAEASASGVVLRWSGAPRDFHAVVERREDSGPWAALGSVSADGAGTIRYEDDDVRAGGRYGYRLATSGGGGGTRYFGETWVDVPHGAGLALAGLRPNPGVGAATVAFTLPAAGPARLELIDVRGRRVAERAWDSLDAGGHVVPLGAGAKLPAGVYVVRLTFAGRTLATNGVILGAH